MMRLIANLSRLITGIVFTFSGFVKVVDPLGTAYKFTDYFVAMHLNFLIDFSLILSVLMCTAELLIGLMLIFNLLPKISSWALLLFMLVFTPLTLWLAVANPVHDCGCFGDALILSNWATFWKNIALLVLTILVFINRKKFEPLFKIKAQWILSVLFGIFGLSICFYALMHLPPIDFRPYKIGANIIEGMEVPESEKNNVDEYKSIFIYEKDGKQAEFDLDNLPDSTWTFVDANHKLVKQGYVPPIHDFSISAISSLNKSNTSSNDDVNIFDALYSFEKNGEIKDFTIEQIPSNDWNFIEIKSEFEINPSMIELIYQSPDGEAHTFSLFNLPEPGYEFIDAYYIQNTTENLGDPDDITDIVLNNKGYTFLLISEDLSKANTKYQEDINKLAAWCETKNYDFICLTASTGKDVKSFIEKTEAPYNFYNTDPITLKTIVRSNPGLVLIKDATVLNKWSYRDFPKIEELNRDLAAYSVEMLNSKKTTNLIYNFIFIGLWIMTVAMWIQHYSRYNRRK